MDKKLVEALQEEGFTFEEIQKVQTRLESMENGTAKYMNHEDFWEQIITEINDNIKDYA